MFHSSLARVVRSRLPVSTISADTCGDIIIRFHNERNFGAIILYAHGFDAPRARLFSTHGGAVVGI
ncbi:hypothetical protein AGMMS49941_11190 [Deferribacterales bacterium]|nr:hypothetical protein AGMMS49941_11190 [Deferribacterales bacterium]